MVLLFNFRLRLFLGKLKSKLSGLFEVVHMTDHDTVELCIEEKKSMFFMNGKLWILGKSLI